MQDSYSSSHYLCKSLRIVQNLRYALTSPHLLCKDDMAKKICNKFTLFFKNCCAWRIAIVQMTTLAVIWRLAIQSHAKLE